MEKAILIKVTNQVQNSSHKSKDGLEWRVIAKEVSSCEVEKNAPF